MTFYFFVSNTKMLSYTLFLGWNYCLLLLEETIVESRLPLSSHSSSNLYPITDICDPQFNQTDNCDTEELFALPI